MRRPTKEDNEAMAILTHRKGDCPSAWEDEFLRSLEERTEEGVFWSDKQATKFDEIWTRMMG